MADNAAQGNDRAASQTLLRRVPLRLLAAILALLFFGIISDSVLDQRTAGFDEQVRSAVHRHATPAVTAFMRDVSLLGSVYFLLPAVLIAITVFLLRRQRFNAVVLAVVMAGALVLEVTLKLAFHRIRPQPFFGIVLPSTYAFPSGHALASLCFYGGMAWIVRRRFRHRMARVMTWILAVGLIALIGLSRIYLGVHYPSDVLGGYLAAIVWVCAVATATRRQAVCKGSGV